ncbi:MAG: HAD family hydrolase, partial [Chloroflexota bacterium]
PEARLANALDKLEVQIQHNLADFSTWTPVEYGLVYTKMDQLTAYDPFLDALCQQIKGEAESKMVENGVDVEAVKNNL